MLSEADAFQAESDALLALIAPLSDAQMNAPTAFKSWSVNDILCHLHAWNMAALWSLTDEARYTAFVNIALPAITKLGSFNAFERAYYKGISGSAMRDLWREGVAQTAQGFGSADPKARVNWVGRSMSVRSSITARLMETWAHSQAIYDAMSAQRSDQDYIQNIVVLGVNTFGWTYAVNSLPTPDAMPYLTLTAPSGAIWTYGEPQTDNTISGTATAFCQVVTQCRNIADVPLKVTGPIASQWMSIAQCFAGGRHAPPAPGMRRIAGSPL